MRLKDVTPKMTANTSGTYQTYQKASITSNAGGYQCFNPSAGVFTFSQKVPTWMSISTTGVPFTVDAFSISCEKNVAYFNNLSLPKSLNVYGSKNINGTGIVLLGTFDISNPTKNDIYLLPRGEYKFYRFDILKTQGASSCSIGEITLYKDLAYGIPASELTKQNVYNAIVNNENIMKYTSKIEIDGGE